MSGWPPELQGGENRRKRRALPLWLWLAGALTLAVAAIFARRPASTSSQYGGPGAIGASRMGAPERAALTPGSSRDASGLARFSGENGVLPAGDSPIGGAARRLVNADHAHAGGTTHRHGEDGKALDGHTHDFGGGGSLSAAEILKNGSPGGKAFGQLADMGLKLDGAKTAPDEDAARR